MRHSGFLQLTHRFLQLTAPIMEQSAIYANLFSGYNTLDGLIYGTFILAEKGLWHLIDFGQSFYVAAALNEQIRKRKWEEIQKEKYEQWIKRIGYAARNACIL